MLVKIGTPEVGLPLSNADQLIASGAEGPGVAVGAAKASHPAEGGADWIWGTAADSASGSSRMLKS